MVAYEDSNLLNHRVKVNLNVSKVDSYLSSDYSFYKASFLNNEEENGRTDGDFRIGNVQDVNDEVDGVDRYLGI